MRLIRINLQNSQATHSFVSSFLGFSFFTCLIALVGCTQSHAQTAAYWRFENIQNQRFLATVQDDSKSGNDLHAFNEDTTPGISKSMPFAVVPQTGEPNHASLDNTEKPGRIMPTRDLFVGENKSGFELSTSSLEQWTIEASVNVKSIENWEKRFETFVGRDGYNVNRGKPLDENPNASLGFKKRGDDNKFSIEAWDSAGNYVVVHGRDIVKADTWYSLAAVSDGETLSLWIKGPGDKQYIKQNEAPFIGPMADTRGGFCVGRGQFFNHPAEQFFGLVDEVRISAGALSPGEFLASPSTHVRPPTTMPRKDVESHALPAAFSPTIPVTAIHVHDPMVLFNGKEFHSFSTHEGLIHYRSDDLIHWTRSKNVLERAPAWAMDLIDRRPGLWAPCVMRMNDQYYFYYSISRFGSQRSAIGLLTSASLDPEEKEYNWIDQGKVIESDRGDPYNAIDPATVIDKDGTPWLTWGSFNKGIFIVQLDAKSGKVANGAKPVQIAHRPKGNAIEGPDVWYTHGHYYLVAAYDFCCRGAASTYKLMIGRSNKITGPYLDREGRPLVEGFGSLLVRSYGPFIGPGHSSLVEKDGKQFVTHHYYDARQNGVATLAVRPLYFDNDNWPMVGEPLGEVSPPSTTLAGDFVAWEDDANPTAISLDPDGTIKSGHLSGTWKLAGQNIVLNWASTGKAKVDLLHDVGFVSQDLNSFIARKADGSILRARRVIK